MTETAVDTYETTTRGAASMAAYRAVRILQLLSENTGEDKAMLSDELIRRLAHPDDPARMPISAARRSIYTAISALRHAGYEIEYKVVRRHAPGIRTTHRHDPKHRVGAAVRCAA